MLFYELGYCRGISVVEKCKEWNSMWKSIMSSYTKAMTHNHKFGNCSTLILKLIGICVIAICVIAICVLDPTNQTFFTPMSASKLISCLLQTSESVLVFNSHIKKTKRQTPQELCPTKMTNI